MSDSDDVTCPTHGETYPDGPGYCQACCEEATNEYGGRLRAEGAAVEKARIVAGLRADAAKVLKDFPARRGILDEASYALALSEAADRIEKETP